MHNYIANYIHSQFYILIHISLSKKYLVMPSDKQGVLYTKLQAMYSSLKFSVLPYLNYICNVEMNEVSLFDIQLFVRIVHYL